MRTKQSEDPKLFFAQKFKFGSRAKTIITLTYCIRLCSYETKDRNPIWKCDCPKHTCGPRPTGGVNYVRHQLYHTENGVLQVPSAALRETVEDIFLWKEAPEIIMDSESDSDSEPQSSDGEHQNRRSSLASQGGSGSGSGAPEPQPKRRKSVQE